MKKAILILVVVLFAVYCYAEEGSVVNTDKDSGYVSEKPAGDNSGIDTSDGEDKAIADKEVYDSPVEYADTYADGTGEREKLLPDYGGGDLGQVDLDD